MRPIFINPMADETPSFERYSLSFSSLDFFHPSKPYQCSTTFNTEFEGFFLLVLFHRYQSDLSAPAIPRGKLVRLQSRYRRGIATPASRSSSGASLATLTRSQDFPQFGLSTGPVVETPTTCRPRAQRKAHLAGACGTGGFPARPKPARPQNGLTLYRSTTA